MLELFAAAKSYGEVHALRGIDLRVDPGTIVGLVGNNGAGKTTCIKLCAGLVEPTAGRVRVDGRDPTEAPVRQLIGFLPEDSPLYDDMTPLAYLRYFGALYAARGAAGRAEALLERLRLAREHWKVPIATLSKGSARKVALVRALLHDPALVILDEPSSGLDPATQAVVDAFLLELRAAGKAILLSAHDLQQVERICDRVVVLHDGAIVMQGTLEQLRGQGPAGYRVRATVAFPGSAPEGPDHVGHVAAWAGVEAAMQHVGAAGGRILDAQAQTPRLADIVRRVQGG